MPDARQNWMSVLAKAPAQDLAARFAQIPGVPDFDWVRAPEIGAVMVQGRAGATGAPFNLGEMTVTRCTLRLATGEVGHAWVQGRDKVKAQQAAVVDGLMQGARAAEVKAAVLDPLAEGAADRKAARAAKAAATKVEFFTMVRGED